MKMAKSKTYYFSLTYGGLNSNPPRQLEWFYQVTNRRMVRTHITDEAQWEITNGWYEPKRGLSDRALSRFATSCWQELQKTNPNPIQLNYKDDEYDCAIFFQPATKEQFDRQEAEIEIEEETCNDG
jgi:hypothetical protein